MKKKEKDLGNIKTKKNIMIIALTVTLTLLTTACGLDFEKDFSLQKHEVEEVNSNSNQNASNPSDNSNASNSSDVRDVDEKDKITNKIILETGETCYFVSPVTEDTYTTDVSTFYLVAKNEATNWAYVGEIDEYDNKPYGYGELYLIKDNEDLMLMYEGYLDAGYLSGQGKLYQGTNEKIIEYEGEFDLGKYQGKGIYYYESGAVNYDGDFIQGKKHGFGKLYYENGNLCYIGGFSEDKIHGEGMYFYNDLNNTPAGIIETKNGKLHGSTLVLDENGNVVSEVYFENGEFIRQVSGDKQINIYDFIID